MIPVKEFHLVHATYKYNLEEILASGSLLSISKGKQESTFFYDKKNNSELEELNIKNAFSKKVFTGLIMPNENNVPNFTFENVDSSSVYLILNPKLIKDYAQCSLEQNADTEVSFPHYCDGWTYGSNTDCIKYDKKKSLKANLNSWREYYLYVREQRLKELKSKKKGPKYLYTRTMFSTPTNELTIQFSKNSNNECIEGEIPLDKYLQAIYVHIESRFEIAELVRKYPQYNWIFG